MAIKRIFRYLVHTPNLDLCYPKGSTFDLLGYSDSDYAVCKVDRRAHLGLANSLGGPWCLGVPRNKTLLPFPLPRLSML
jgi:hypothetical protein